LAVQWLNEALCFVSSSVVADSLRLRNRQLLEVQSELKKRDKKVGLRHIEAALFMIGYDISNYK